jgi:CRP-like cAMP-binding protein
MARQGSTNDRLAAVPLFEGLSKKHLGQIARLMTELDLPAGKVLTQEGQRGREFIILLEGEAEVTREGKTIATRGPGEYVGEIALLDDRPRTATVTAKTDVVAEVLSRQEFTSLLASSPEISSHVMATMAQRLAELDRDAT